MSEQVLIWAIFGVLVLGLLFLDLVVFHRKAHVVSFKEAVIWSVVWIAISLLFNLGVYFWYGAEPALEFLTGYAVEKSLSVDMLFVFYLVFSTFGVPEIYKHKVLFWGILGALAMRAALIAAGITLFEVFHWMIYPFGLFLMFTGLRMAVEKGKAIHPEKNPVVRFFRRFMPVADRLEGDKFFVKTAEGRKATPLFIVLLIIETTDFVFAVDSIPAILAITKDPFIVYTSNVFAMLGLRALYFAVAGFVRLFRYLHYGFSIILVFVGVKMLLSDMFEIPAVMALAVVASVLSVSVIASFAQPLEEEIKSLLEGGTEAGVFEKAEQEMVTKVFRLGDQRVDALMTRRTDIVWIDANDSVDEIRRKIAESGFSRFPVGDRSLDNVVGVVQAKDLLARTLAGEPVDLKVSLQQPLFVPRSTPALQVLELFKQSGQHIALVVDEYGSIGGLLTHHDILEAIAGEIPFGEKPVKPKGVQRHDGSWLLDGMLSVEEFKEIFHLENLPGEKRDAYQTLGGFLFTQMGRVPSVSDHFEWSNLRFEIVDMDGKRIDKVLVVTAETDSSRQESGV